MLGGLFAGFVVVCLMLLALHTLQFIGLRIRNEAVPATERDPHLGRKFALHLFQHFAILMALSGFTISAIDIADSVLLPFQNKAPGQGGFGGGRGGIFFDEDFDDGFRGGQQTFTTSPFGSPMAAPPKPARSWWNSAQRFAVGLILSGILHGSAIFAILLVGTNNAKFPAAGRAFGVTRFVIAGIILMGCATAMILAVLQKGSTDYRGLSMVIGMLAVWGPTALGHLVWMRWTMNPPKKGTKRRPAERDDEADEPEEPEPRKVRKAGRAPEPREPEAE
jgi:hypothetical protein